MSFPAKSAARFALGMLHRVLPTPVYSAVERTTLNGYRAALRARYYQRILAARAIGDHATALRSQTVYAVMPYSLVGTAGLERTYDLAKSVLSRNPDATLVECGVARGGCATLLGLVAQQFGRDSECWFFDSFEGLPDPTLEDYVSGKTGDHVRPLTRGSCHGTLDDVSTATGTNPPSAASKTCSIK
jgi:hypothetical protein